MIFNPPQSWGMRISNASAQRISATWGTVVTSGSYVWGSWSTLLAGSSVPSDIFDVSILIHSSYASSASRNMLVDIGIDPDGGTNFTTIIPRLIGSPAGNLAVGAPYVYRFPLYIPAGASIGARALGSSAFNCYVVFNAVGKPSNPDAVCCGTKVLDFGANEAAARGTAITVGTTSEGAWTLLGTVLDMPLWWWQIGFTVTASTCTAVGYTLDLAIGDDTNKKIALLDVFANGTTSESLSILPGLYAGQCDAAVGNSVYARAQCGGTVPSTPTMMAWGLG